MAEINYKVTFFSDWLCSSGLSGGSESDVQVIKNNNGLPFIPGRTIKGLVKEGAKDLFELEKDDEGYKSYTDFMTACFGYEEEEKNDPDRVNETGFSYFNAEFSSQVAKHFISNPAAKEKLSREIQSTKINAETGVAENKTLRTKEVAVPVTIYGKINNKYDIEHPYNVMIKDCLKMIKRLGVNRNRGLGRCKFDILETKEGGQK